MFFAPMLPHRRSILPLATSIVASWYWPKESADSDEVNRSVEKTRCLPSGDHAGWRSEYGSEVSARSFPPGTSRTKRSVNPPLSALKAIDAPSGDHVGLNI